MKIKFDVLIVLVVNSILIVLCCDIFYEKWHPAEGKNSQTETQHRMQQIVWQIQRSQQIKRKPNMCRNSCKKYRM